MKKFIVFTVLSVFIFGQFAHAQSDKLTMAKIRMINSNVMELARSYESYSLFSSSEDYVQYYKQLFISPDVHVYRDVFLNDSIVYDTVPLNDYIDLVRNNYKETSVSVNPSRISVPVITGKTGQVELELTKIISGKNNCKVSVNDTLSLVFTIQFKVNRNDYDNFKIAKIVNPSPPGKHIIVNLKSMNGKILSGESFLVDGVSKKTDVRGGLDYFIKNPGQPINIAITGKGNAGVFHYGSYGELFSHRLPGQDPCKPVTIELVLEKLSVAPVAVVAPKPKVKTRSERKTSFEIGVTGNYMLPVDGPVKVVDHPVSLTLTTDYGYGGGIFFAWEFKMGPLGKFQLQSGVNYFAIGFKSGVDLFNTQYSEVDPEGMYYTRMIEVTNAKETDQLSYLSIPLVLEKEFCLGQSGFAITVNAGGQYMKLLNATYSSTATGSYKGYYRDLCNLTMDRNVYDFGVYQLTSSEKLFASPSFFVYNAGAGVTKKFNNIFSVFVKGNYMSSIGNVFEKKDVPLTKNKSQLGSLMNNQNTYKLSSFYLTLGISFSL